MVDVAREEAPRTSGTGQSRSATLVGLLIVAISIFGAVVTWQAATVSGDSSDLDQRARQSRIQEAQLRAQGAAMGAFERRLFVRYREHVTVAAQLDAAARRADGAEARRLTMRAQHERGMARSLDVLFYAAAPFDDQNRADYQEADAQTFFDSDSALDELGPAALEDAAAVGRRKAFWLVAVDTALIAAIFFSTLALLGEALRRGLAVAGLALSVIATAGVLVVILAIHVPAP